MDTHSLIGKVITRAHAIDKLLRKHYPASNPGLFAAISSLGDTLPAVLVRSIRAVGVIRNAAAHPDGFKPGSVPPDFDRLCNEIELLIPYFAGLQLPKPVQPPKQPPPAVAKPQATAACVKPMPAPPAGVATIFPANHGKPWTSEEDKLLVEAFDAQSTIPELGKAHQRGVGAVQHRLIKFGRLTAGQFTTIYPPESE